MKRQETKSEKKSSRDKSDKGKKVENHQGFDEDFNEWDGYKDYQNSGSNTNFYNNESYGW